ncbi:MULTISPECIES: 3-hydroxybutyryl-CoA dehydrogenase [Priestia]|uniref:3-hydroxybutyryl-CoA dehydrogenase n=2 Tax=Priestia megaterium TaxID=1404 RepID=D5DWJ7_PRIM1|nr:MULTISPECIES: 3-hydroxybutyryl-CoA dehydrogenase [Priestia]KQU18119.1 3-hydroxybutyryl-CoA dehydrogenase [Bacillus sp. Leaf75]KRF47448.1 3-hydroxybutyryl-CoA dehydrogenase [Bacillus sp. Soil531]MBZ5481787.1 3-hydroxybutyryl-CoA dehydrogenase [Bacillus sp. T_4]MCF6799036.1 3-hydroxybutyryl-CoA dehydrogenase [Bacillus sp. ET1]MDH6651820.1 3-hydroxybutyryl-CoA dehydrogenase [Bacillus sp. PvP124]MDP9578895.1 3-hydroxybutyryl-CoA dehydrogenase [Bacillus sp. 1751]
MNIETVMVIGAGQMGAGIAQVFAASGYQVSLYDVDQKNTQKGIEGIDKRLKKQVGKGSLSAKEYEEIMERLHLANEITAAQKADLIVEAVVEKMEVKQAIFAELDSLAPSHTVLATNTSSLPITEIAAVTTRPEKVIGMHFMNPVPVMKLVEIIRGLATTDEVYQAVYETTKKLNKTPVEVHDFPGFVSNRILMPMINEAVFTLYEGVANEEDIDQVMKLGMNHPMGPLTLADFIGLDTCLFIMETLHKGFGDDKYRPCPLLRKYVKAGWLGRKTGKGFFTYET